MSQRLHSSKSKYDDRLVGGTGNLTQSAGVSCAEGAMPGQAIYALALGRANPTSRNLSQRYSGTNANRVIHCDTGKQRPGHSAEGPSEGPAGKKHGGPKGALPLGT